MLLFCSDPLNPRQPDEAYQAEVAAAERLGIQFALVDHDALAHDNDPVRAVRRVPPQPQPDLALYRGWMLTPDQYRLLDEALEAKGLRLLNDPAAYRHCHYLPESYPVIEPYTPRSVWIKTKGDVSTDEIMDLLHPFGSAPVVGKDYVKSRKHEWAEACYLAPHDPPPAGVVHLLKDDEKEEDEDYNADVILEPDWAVVGITPGGVYGMLKKKWPKAIFGQELCDLLVLDEASQMNLPEALMAALALVVGTHFYQTHPDFIERVLRRPDGSVFALSQVDDFDVEVELLRNNPEFLTFLKELSQEEAMISQDDLRKELKLDRKRGGSKRKNGKSTQKSGRTRKRGRSA